MSARTTRTARARRQAAPEPELSGLDSITSELVALLGVAVDRSTTGRWLERGVRGHRIRGRRVGKSWRTTRSALVEFARASGAIEGGDA